ncbi:MAG: ribonuclease H family protein [Bacteroidales bacterium]|jgi:ribonuclease HI|nr:ribonuclease H family protein [Bacteroidales bacterium]
MNKKKYYVVWVGRKIGIFEQWKDCKASVEGIENARYKSFLTEKEAKQAYNSPYYNYFNKNDNTKLKQTKQEDLSYLSNQLPIIDSIATDAACSGNPGVMEYQGVYIKTGKRIFYYKADYGTNNIGEFLGIVHGLSYLKRHNLRQPLYSDSVNAIKWVKKKKCQTKLELNSKTKELFDYIHSAERWLENNTYTTQIIKWDTEHWGEIPADFGRKK